MAIDPILVNELVKVGPSHSVERYRRVPLDPRLARKLLSSGYVSSEERPVLQKVVLTSRWSPPQRAVYASVLDGATDITSVSAMTGMTETEVSQVVNQLAGKGILRRVAV